MSICTLQRFRENSKITSKKPSQCLNLVLSFYQDSVKKLFTHTKRMSKKLGLLILKNGQNFSKERATQFNKNRCVSCLVAHRVVSSSSSNFFTAFNH